MVRFDTKIDMKPLNTVIFRIFFFVLISIDIVYLYLYQKNMNKTSEIYC